jgi:D-inositol-3-phosphate glycosyltransferase
MVVGTVPKPDMRGAVFGSGYMLRCVVETGLFDEIDIYAPTVGQQLPYEAMVASQAWMAGRTVRVRQAIHLHRHVTADEYDVVFAPTFSTEVAALATLREQTGARFRIISMVYTISYPETEGSILQNLLAPLREDDLLNCTSETGFTAVLTLVGHLRTKFRVPLPLVADMAAVPYGIDTTWFRPGDRVTACLAVGLNPSERHILSLGRFAVVDKFDLGPVVEAFVRARATLGPGWRLVLAGANSHGAYAEWVRLLVATRRLQDYVTILTDVSDEQKRDLYRAADMFLAPSDSPQETFGLTAIEAMACGVPVIASDWNGYKESVVHGESGMRVPTYMPRLPGLMAPRHLVDNSLMHLMVAQSVAIDVGRLADAMVLLGSDEKYRSRLAEGARARAVSQYDVYRIAGALRAVLTLRETLAASGGGEASDGGSLDDLVPTVDGSGSLWDLFGDFGTRSLHDGDMLQTSAYGQQGLGEMLPVYLTPEMEQVLYPELVRPLCRACATPAPFGHVRGALVLGNPDAERVEYTIYWAIKQGLIDVNSRLR